MLRFLQFQGREDMRIIVIQRYSRILDDIRVSVEKLNKARARAIFFTTSVLEVLDEVEKRRVGSKLFIVSGGALDSRSANGGAILARAVKERHPRVFFCLYSIMPIYGPGVDAYFDKEVGGKHLPLARMLTANLEEIPFHLMGQHLGKEFPEITLY